VALLDGHKFQPGQDKKTEKAESVRSSNVASSLNTAIGAKAEAFARNVPKIPESIRGRVTADINQYFPLGSYHRRRFDELCAKCDAEALFSYSLLLCDAACRWPKRSLYEMRGTSASELRKLPTELEELACKIDRVGGLLSSFMSAQVIDNDQAPTQERVRGRNRVAVYKHVPKTLRVFAADLRTAFEWIDPRFGPKKYDTLRGQVLNLLRYVDGHTGSPHYEHLADILGHLFPNVVLRNGGDPKRETPALLNSADALKQLYLRWTKRGLGRPEPRPSRQRAS
jgi:hypothetical protein